MSAYSAKLRYIDRLCHAVCRNCRQACTTYTVTDYVNIYGHRVRGKFCDECDGKHQILSQVQYYVTVVDQGYEYGPNILRQADFALTKL